MNNKRLLIPSLMLLHAFIGFAYASDEQSQEALENEAKLKINSFATQLKQALVGAIQKDGLHSAVDVCHQQAPAIAQALSSDGWVVARTSLKIRNSANQPDEWETQALMSFDKQFKEGAAVNTLIESKLAADQFRLIKAIPTGQVCLACHGSNVEPALLESINALYPNDTAINFTLEDIRGAFTVTKQLGD